MATPTAKATVSSTADQPMWCWRPDLGDGREDRPGTGHEDETEAEAEDESAALGHFPTGRQADEGALQQVADVGTSETEPQHGRARRCRSSAGASPAVPAR